MEVTSTQLENFADVWKQLLRQKVKIVSEIARHKQVDFYELLKEFIPEAFEHKNVWEQDYVLPNTTQTPPSSSKSKKLKIMKPTSHISCSISSASSTSSSDNTTKKLRINIKKTTTLQPNSITTTTVVKKRTLKIKKRS